MRDGHLEETLRRILAAALTTRAKDPRLNFVTVTEVRLNKDKSVADVFFTVTGEDAERRAAQWAMRRSEGFLRQQIQAQLRLRTIPQLRFRYDESLDRSFRLEQLLDELRAQRQAEGGPVAEPPPGAGGAGGTDEAGRKGGGSPDEHEDGDA
jgi:ribosome-binding factor A